MDIKHNTSYLFLNPLFSQFTVSLPVNLPTDNYLLTDFRKKPVLATWDICSQNRRLKGVVVVKRALFKWMSHVASTGGKSIPLASRCHLGRGSLRGALPARGSHVRCVGQPGARLDGFASCPERSLVSVGASPLTHTRPWPGSSTFELPCHLADPLLRPLPSLL